MRARRTSFVLCVGQLEALEEDDPGSRAPSRRGRSGARPSSPSRSPSGRRSATTGPNAVPPWRWIGGRPPPCRARPVCFCLKGFLPEPETSERTFVLCVPRCSRARISLTASHTRWRRNGTPKISAGSVASPTVSALRFRTGSVRVDAAAIFFGRRPSSPPPHAAAPPALPGGLLHDLDDRVPRAGDRAAEVEQVVLGVHADDDRGSSSSSASRPCGPRSGSPGRRGTGRPTGRSSPAPGGTSSRASRRRRRSRGA